MPDPIVVYEFDQTGTAVANKIIGEQHAVTEANYRNYYFIVPKFAPFFIEGLVITHTYQGVTRTLTEDVDFYASLSFIGASRAIGKPIYGAISLNNLNTAGIISITYQTLGGNWNIDQQIVIEKVAEKAYNPRTTSWESIVDLPAVFPPIPHQWDLVDMVGEKELVDALHRIEAAILTAAQQEWTNHIHNYNNPHQVTKAQLGLENVGNWARASVEQTIEGVSTETLVVPATLRAVLTSFFNKTEINAFLNAQNIQITENDQQIAATAVELLSHKADLDNPHQVSKGEVGLGLVENLAVVTDAEIDANVAIDPDKYLTFNKFLRYMERFGNGSIAPNVQLVDCAGVVLGYVYDVGTQDPMATVPFSYADNIIIGYVSATPTVHCNKELFNCEGTLLGYIKAEISPNIVTHPESALSFVNRLSTNPAEVTRLKGILGL